jgi:hypothetical protein
VRALIEPKVAAKGYPDDSWVSAQHYDEHRWIDLIDTWLAVNQLNLQVWARVPEEKKDVPCRIGVDDPIPLSELLARYVKHNEDFVGQILSKG